MMIGSWITYLSNQGRSEHTIASYRRALKQFIQWSEQTYGQPFDPAAIIPRDIADWKSFQQTIQKAAPATINQRLAALSNFFQWAMATGQTGSDPATGISSLRLDPRSPKALDDKQTRRLLRAVYKGRNLRDIAIVELLLGTGLRVSEALALEKNDITLGERSGHVAVRQGKGGQPRTVPLTAPVRKAIRDYLDNRQWLGANLWVGQRGPLKDPSAINKMLEKYALQANIDSGIISPHILRHTFSTRYLAQNPNDLRGLAAILGHASLDTVMIYTEPTTADLARRMEQL